MVFQIQILKDDYEEDLNNIVHMIACLKKTKI